MATKKKAPEKTKVSAPAVEFGFRRLSATLPNPALNVPGVEAGYFEASSQKCDVMSPDRRGYKLRSCPVQLAFIKGVPHLRFCTEFKKDAFLMKVKSGADAYYVAQKACEAAGFASNNRLPFDRGLLKRANVEVEEALGRLTRGRRA